MFASSSGGRRIRTAVAQLPPAHPTTPCYTLHRTPHGQAHPLLLALGQEPGIADVAARYLRILAPSLFIVVTSDTTRRYFLAQRIVWPGLIAAVMTVRCHRP